VHSTNQNPLRISVTYTFHNTYTYIYITYTARIITASNDIALYRYDIIYVFINIYFACTYIEIGAKSRGEPIRRKIIILCIGVYYNIHIYLHEISATLTICSRRRPDLSAKRRDRNYLPENPCIVNPCSLVFPVTLSRWYIISEQTWTASRHTFPRFLVGSFIHQACSATLIFFNNAVTRNLIF